MGTTARLIYADSETNADLYYLTSFLAGDPFLFVEQGGKRTLLLSDLEIDRGRRESSVDEVLRLQKITEEVRKRRHGPCRYHLRSGDPGMQVLDPARVNARGKVEFPRCGPQIPGFLEVRFDEIDAGSRPFHEQAGNDQARESAARTDVQPSPRGRRS